MAAFDANLMIRTTGNLTQAESGYAIINGTPITGLAARVCVPTAFHDDDQLLVYVDVSADNSTYTRIAQSLVNSSLKATPKDIYVIFRTDKKYARIGYTVTSTTAANVNFGAVKAGFVLPDITWAR